MLNFKQRDVEIEQVMAVAAIIEVNCTYPATMKEIVFWCRSAWIRPNSLWHNPIPFALAGLAHWRCTMTLSSLERKSVTSRKVRSISSPVGCCSMILWRRMHTDSRRCVGPSAVRLSTRPRAKSGGGAHCAVAFVQVSRKDS